MPDYRERKRPPMTKKQIMIQMTLCVAILAFFAFQEAFFPTDEQKKASPTPTVSAQAVLEASGAETLTADAVGVRCRRKTDCRKPLGIGSCISRRMAAMYCLARM